MKKYSLSAEFIRWEGTEESAGHPDSFTYILELESDEEAKVRLDTLIIERMSSKPGSNYQLVNSGFSEFLSSDTSDKFIENQTSGSDTISLSDQAVYLEQTQSSNEQISNPDPSGLPAELLSKDDVNHADKSLEGKGDSPPEIN